MASPHPIFFPRPIKIAGIPGMEPPMTVPLDKFILTNMKLEGAVSAECGSLAANVDPVAEREGITAKIFEAPKLTSSGVCSQSRKKLLLIILF